MFSHGETLPLGPGTNLAAPLAAGRRSCPGARPLLEHHACMFHKWSKQAAELAGMPGAQIDLVLPAVHAKFHGLVGRAASQVVLKMHFDPLHYFPPNCALRVAADPKAELALQRHSLPRTDVSRTVPRPSQQTALPPGSGSGGGYGQARSETYLRAEEVVETDNVHAVFSFLQRCEICVEKRCHLSAVRTSSWSRSCDDSGGQCRASSTAARRAGQAGN